MRAELMTTDTDRAYYDNLRLSQLEYQQRHVYLHSRPRCLGLVLGNACNIDCIHCYQAKNGDNLLRPPKIAEELRRELMAFYPYLSTLRIQGGEVFAIRGFRELIDDVAKLVQRPILSISTNGTLIDDEWAERIVRTPFSNDTCLSMAARELRTTAFAEAPTWIVCSPTSIEFRAGRQSCVARGHTSIPSS